ncbi:MBL fold metallo-hydrolase [uncultured Hydrogenophaga sp.]|uniref:MBL fold metallo-hydrolase n=1 Tax=uncultured Hydrogenophaga sp. TaxID=199683 RepID=UPI00265FF008|nr:MBL fold metallo-hydrolase [uncultured Hydrogenophaga sp.]
MKAWRSALVLSCALAAWGVQAQPVVLPPCERAEPVPWRELAPGVWVWEGANQEVSPANAGHVAPVSVVVDAGEALVIDPGPGLLHGLRVRASMACQFQARVVQVVNTHAHAENVLGNAAFADLPIAANAGTHEAMVARCPDCLESLTLRAGRDAMAGTRIVWPSRLLRAGDVLSVGRMSLQVLASERGHTASDLVLWLPQQRVLWAGGLAYDGRLPELAQGSIEQWLAALGRLQQRQPRWVVASRVGDAGLLQATRHYLQTLRQRVLAAMDAGRHAGELQAVAMDEWAGWVGFEERQGFNTQRAWRELETVWMDQPLSPGASPVPASVDQVGR